MAAELDREQHRVLVVDDDPLVRRSFRRLLVRGSRTLERATQGPGVLRDEARPPRIEVDTVARGEEALALVVEAHAEGRPYSVAFVDVRMPPGWDGVETSERLWQVAPSLQIVICTAHSDYAWGDLVNRLGHRDGLLILKKPFDVVEALQMVYNLTRKWTLNAHARLKLSQLEQMTAERTRELAETDRQLQNETEERQRMAVELQQAQKLEAVGQLASGIAHEVNTPIQFVGDNVQFLGQSFDDLWSLLSAYREALAEGAERGEENPRFATVRALEAATDVAFLEKHVPRAIEAALEGLDRISRIVRAMKTYAYPSTDAKAPADLNQAIRGTLAVAHHEYKYVATVETELGELPLVRCRVGDLSSVFLNLVVNAVHAIEDAGRGGAGRIVIRSALRGRDVVVGVTDNGCGICETQQQRVFDPLFTTKEVGRGTGQGLSLAHAIVVQQHGGSLTLQSEEGVGTTFTVRIPVDGAPEATHPPEAEDGAQPNTLR